MARRIVFISLCVGVVLPLLCSAKPLCMVSPQNKTISKQIDSLLATPDTLRVLDSLYRLYALDSLETLPKGYVFVDSLVYVPLTRYTDSLVGKDVLIGDSTVVINQSDSFLRAAKAQVEANATNIYEVDGYRIRIYLDNKQESRDASEKAEKKAKKLFPYYQTYRTYAYPNFKVTVGDFRTKAEAQIALKSVVKYFPSAFIVKEKMKFPVVSQSEAYKVDTIKLIKCRSSQ